MTVQGGINDETLVLIGGALVAVALFDSIAIIEVTARMIGPAL